MDDSQVEKSTSIPVPQNTLGALRSNPSQEPLSYVGGHRGSISTVTTDSNSADTSPVAGSSFPRASAYSDTPGTSPDTPASLGVPKHPGSESKDLRLSPTAPATRKPRNLKNLALNTSKTFPLTKGPNTGIAPLDTPAEGMTTPTPMATGFVRPVSQARRNPSLSLSLKTPTNEAATGSLLDSQSQVPPTPSFARPSMFRGLQSSPALTTLSTHTRGPSRNFASAGGFPQSFAEHDEYLTEDGQYHAPLSREEKLDAYPNGPITIYDPHIDLYLEPTAAQARDYDVIMNVASEVLNPFAAETNTHIPSKSLHTAAQELLTGSSSSQKAADSPEYIHVPWEHNTDIVPDLYELVKVVDDRVQKGKRLLIHCQCGVSRSASLIVAYGIYKNPALSVQQCYDAVKQKSRWIGPNMNLIMQLQEFRSGLIKSALETSNTRSTSRLLHNRQTSNELSAGLGASSDLQVPQTAPLPQFDNMRIPSPIKTQHVEKISPGPSSAPSGLNWPRELPSSLPLSRIPSQDALAAATMTIASSKTELPPPMSKKDTPHSSPHRKLVPLAPIHLDLPTTVNTSHQVAETPRGTEFAMTSIRPSSAFDETFGITSPRASGFPSMPSVDEEALASPRSEEFAMAPVLPRELDDTITLGLTSPRTKSFFDLPYRFNAPAPFEPPTQHHVALQPTYDQADAQARAQLRSQLGFSTSRSVTDLQQLNQSTVTRPAAPIPSQQDSVRPTLVSRRSPELTTTAEDDYPDALMSPRAVEFTTNPMREALEAATTTIGNAGRPSSPAESDPRSPPVRGINPITRDIFDVL